MTISIGLLLAVTGAALSIYTLLKYPFTSSTGLPLDVNMQVIGIQLMSTGQDGYALPFEVISILLLAAMIAAIVIAKKGK